MKLAPLLFGHEFEPHPADATALASIDDPRMRFRLTPSGRIWEASASRRFRDDQAVQLLALPHLISFVCGYPFMDNPPFSDAGVRQLRQHPRLQAFMISDNTRITDDSLTALARDTRIKWLKVPHCSITDTGVSCLVTCNQLLQLSLVGNSVSDKSIPTLLQLQKLTHLGVSNTSVSDAGLEELASKLPRCRIL